MTALICSIIQLEKNFFPHFLKHYSVWGVDKFFIDIYYGENNSAWNEITEYKKDFNIELYKAEKDYWNVFIDMAFKNKIRLSLEKDDWIIPSDIDEFHTIENYSNFNDVQNDCLAENASFVSSKLVDRTTVDGTIPKNISPDISIWDQFPKNRNLGEEITKGCTKKVCMQRQHVPILAGHHDLLNTKKHKPFSKNALTYHFKWFGDLYNKEMYKIKMRTLYNQNWNIYAERLLQYIDNNHGKL